MSEPQTYPYATYLNVRFPALSLVDVPALVAACDRPLVQPDTVQGEPTLSFVLASCRANTIGTSMTATTVFFVLDGHFIIDLARPVHRPASATGLCRTERASHTARARLNARSFSWLKPLRLSRPETPSLGGEQRHASYLPLSMRARISSVDRSSLRVAICQVLPHASLTMARRSP